MRAVGVADGGDVDAVHFLGLAGELDPELLAAGVEFAEIVDAEAELDRARGLSSEAGWSARTVSPVANSLQKGDWNFSSRPSLSR